MRFDYQFWPFLISRDYFEKVRAFLQPRDHMKHFSFEFVLPYFLKPTLNYGFSHVQEFYNLVKLARVVEDAAGSNSGAYVLFFQNLDIFKMS